jgi:6-hydroxycyclohex-1-ene-1-carbonyl-CoA dehydrogenase
MKAIEAKGFYFTEVGKPLVKKDFSIPQPQADDVIVAVSGCGLCHTDLEFLSGSVKTAAALPLILGHEISGQVVAAGGNYEKLIGANVIIPVVLPCGECDLCKSGRSNICPSRKMPGNNFNGGFASHLSVPGRFLCTLPTALGGFKVSTLCVVADAVTTPYQSLLRSRLHEGDLAIVIGAGGIGIYMVQLAAATGAAVIALDINDEKIERAKRLGARFGINIKGFSETELKYMLRSFAKVERLPEHKWKVFETSGTAEGQVAAFSLLSNAGTIAIVGFTMDKVAVRLSNLMAFDADMFGNWGCKPEYYPDVVEKVLKKEINILDTVEEQPLDLINEVIDLVKQRKLEKRVIFVP